MAKRAAIDVRIDIYEPRDFSVPGPEGCNMCGGIVSESLVQALAVEGIHLPDDVVQRAIDSYILHTNQGNVHIETPHNEKRIATLHRGAGPKGVSKTLWKSFDALLLNLARGEGARVLPARVCDIVWRDKRPEIECRGKEPRPYDLVVVACGVNTSGLRLLENLGFGYRRPQTMQTFITEIMLGRKTIQEWFGSSMHLFLLSNPSIEFAAFIPKGDFVTVCLLGRSIDRACVRSFFKDPAVRGCFPPTWRIPDDACRCSPKINVGEAIRPYADRVVAVGDCGVSRLYKDGIGAAYRTAKAAARTAIFSGVSAQDFDRHYAPIYSHLRRDNWLGRVLFSASGIVKRSPASVSSLLCVTAEEQKLPFEKRRMSGVLWDMFTGSAAYGDILRRSMHPALAASFVQHIVRACDAGLEIVPKGGCG